MLTYEVVMVIIAIAGGLMGVAGKFFWDKLKLYDNHHVAINGKVDELDTRLSARINTMENRTTAIESTTVTKDDLFQMANVLREDSSRNNEKIYDKLEILMGKIEELRYERSRRDQ